jgi:hypothetical protein
MNPTRLDALLRSLAQTPSRRAAVHVLVGTTVGLLAVEGRPTVAKKKGKGKKGKDKKSPASRQCPTPPCAPECKGKTCGPDGCSGSCGACNEGTCRNGICDCSDSNQELCGGNCVNLCTATERRNPFTCACCTASNQSVPGVGDCTPACCSRICTSVRVCIGFPANTACQFHAQCNSGNCLANGTCA